MPKLHEFDEKDLHILNLLQEDARMSLTNIAKRIGTSVDTARSRLIKLQEKGVFFQKIQIRPRQLGYPYIVDVKIKLHNYDSKKIAGFIAYLEEHPRVAELFSISGEWDYTIVIIAEDHEDLARIGDEIRKKFSFIIKDWQESLTKVAYKFERYDLFKLRNYEEKR